MAIKRITEGTNGVSKLIVTPQSKTIDDDALLEDIYQLSYNGVTIMSKDQNDGFPMPWDADFGIEGDNLVLEGGAGPSGFGHCITKVPISRANNIIDIEIQWRRDQSNQENSSRIESIISKLKDLGYDVR
jgi:hypothetical protein